MPIIEEYGKRDVESLNCSNHSSLADLPDTHLAAETLLTQEELPCAIAGPFHDYPMLELSAIVAALKIPITAHRAFSIRALGRHTAPYSSQVFPDVIVYSTMLALYLIHKGRTNYVALVFSLTETGLDRRETGSILLDSYGIENQAFAYNSFLSPATSEERTVEKALQGVVDSGYRTIVVAPELPSQEIPLLAKVAVEKGLTNGDYMWVWFGDFDPMIGNDDPIIREFLAGSVFLTPLEGYHLSDDDPFLQSWKNQGPSEVERLNRANPVSPGEPGYFVANNSYFETLPEWGSSFLYDAIMSTGIGACLALDSAENGTDEVPIESFVEGIRSVNFTGATGVIRFCSLGGECGLDGARDPFTLVWAVLNNYPPDGVEIDGPWELTEIYYFPEVSSDFIFPNGSLLYDFIPQPEPESSLPEHNGSDPVGKFLLIHDTAYADGRTVPPDLLRDPTEKNYLSSGVRIVGFTLLGIAWLTALTTAIWVFMHHKHQVVRAAQPYFLYLVCFGASVSVSAIFTLSFDESYGWSEDKLSSACMATPWLASLGHIITYGALFSKLWRVNRVLQFARRKVNMIHVAWPSALLAALALVVLGLWTGLDPLTWTRTETNVITGESIGECVSETPVAYIVPLIVILLIPTLLTMYMAWKTKDVDDAYSESRWIFIMVLVQVEVLLFMVPLIPLLHDVSTDGRYIGYSLLLWTFPMSAMCLIVGPKVFAVHRRKERSSGLKRGATGHVRVSGLRPMGSPSPHGSSPTPTGSSGLRTSSEQLHQRHSHNTQSEGTQTDPAEDLPTNLPGV